MECLAILLLRLSNLWCIAWSTWMGLAVRWLCALDYVWSHIVLDMVTCPHPSTMMSHWPCNGKGLYKEVWSNPTFWRKPMLPNKGTWSSRRKIGVGAFDWINSLNNIVLKAWRNLDGFMCTIRMKQVMNRFLSLIVSKRRPLCIW